MKIRKGFVSNSSSSSFIIAKAVIGEEEYNKLFNLLERLDCQDEDESWGDSGQTWSAENGYLLIEVNNAPDEARNAVYKYRDKAIVIEG
jgi:hypothetical protein